MILDAIRKLADKRVALNGNKLYDLCGHIPALLDEIERLQGQLLDLSEWIDVERRKIGAIDGYDYRSGEEFGLRRAQCEIDRRLKSPPPPSPCGGGGVMMDEAQKWKNIALYLASCHAATAEYDGTLKGVSAARKQRYRSICETALRCIRAGDLVGVIKADEVAVIDRLLAVVNE